MAKLGVELVLDIETYAVPVAPHVKEFLIGDYEPPKNYKDPEKIAKHREEFMKNLDEQSCFKPYGNKLIAVGMAVVSGEKIVGAEARLGTEEELTQFFIDYLNDIGPKFVVIGCNIKFDLSNLLARVNKFGMSSRNKISKWSEIDLLYKPYSGYSAKTAALAMGVKIPKFTGADVQQLVDDGKLEEVRQYNHDDVIMESELFICAKRIHSFE